MKIKLDFKDKKNIIAAGIFISAFVLLFQFVYLPKYREIKILVAEYKKVTGEIDNLYDFIGGRKNLEKNIVEVRKRLVSLEDAFPSEKEVSNIIKHLNEEARYFSVSVRSVKPRNISIYKDREGREVKIWDYFCKYMPLSLNLEAGYQEIGEFLATLEANRSPMITIAEVTMKRDEDIAPRVRAEIDLNAFMLGK